MPIELSCPSCGQSLRLADNQAGMQARCPQCQHVFVAPGGTASAASPAGTTEHWRVRTPTNETYGPVTRPELNTWVAEGRLNDRCQLLREGSDRWQPAAEVFPVLQNAGGAGPYSSPASVAAAPLPGKVQAVRVMMIVGGAIALLTAVSVMIASACLWLVYIYGFILGIMAIVRGSNMTTDRRRPTAIAVMQIVNIINCDIVNVVLGIIELVFLNDPECREYFK